MAQKALDALKKKFSSAVEDTAVEHGDEIAYIKADKLREVAEWLATDPKMKFDAPVFVTCIDRLGDDGPRFEVCYQLRSNEFRYRLRLKVRVSDDKPKVPSLAELYPAFNWQERETYDMYGIEFEGHPDLRRIYMYKEFEGHPLRKDYPKDKRQPLVRRDWSEEPTEL